MSIKTDFLPYTDSFGLIQPDGNGTSGNGILYTAEYVAALVHANDLDSQEKQRLISVLESCEKQPGLLWRAPLNKDDQEGPDDYVGIGYTAKFLNHPDIAKRIVEYGRVGVKEYDPSAEDEGKRFWSKVIYKILSLFGNKTVKNVWNNANPGKFTLSAWLGRQLNLMAHLKFAANIDPSCIEKLVWCLAILKDLFEKKSNKDSWVLSWLAVKTAKNKSFICDVVGSIWIWKFKRTWKNGMGELLGSYFNNINHPLAIHLMNVF